MILLSLQNPGCLLNRVSLFPQNQVSQFLQCSRTSFPTQDHPTAVVWGRATGMFCHGYPCHPHQALPRPLLPCSALPVCCPVALSRSRHRHHRIAPLCCSWNFQIVKMLLLHIPPLRTGRKNALSFSMAIVSEDLARDIFERSAEQS